MTAGPAGALALATAVAVKHYHRNVRCRLFLLAWLVLLLLAGCYSGTRPPRIGEVAPDFAVQDSGRKVALADLRGQVVVLNFWATWCPPCVEEMPSLENMQQRLKQKGVTVLAVSLDVDESAYRRFLSDHKIDLLTVRDSLQKSGALYGTFKYPESYVIDRQGIVRRKFVGPVDWNQPEIVGYLEKM